MSACAEHKEKVIDELFCSTAANLTTKNQNLKLQIIQTNILLSHGNKTRLIGCETSVKC